MSKIIEVSPVGSALNQIKSAYLNTGGLAKFIPEPRNGLGEVAGKVVRGLASTFGGDFSYGGDYGGSTISPEYSDLLSQQIEIQTQMQLVSMHSNVEKSRHETQMAAIRNIRVG